MTSQRNIDPRESQDSSDVQRVNSYPKGNLFKRLFRIELRAEAVVNLDDVVGEIDPRIYGHFISAPKFFGWDGHEQDAEVADLFKALNPPVCRYQVGSDANRVELDAFLAFCEKVGAQPYLSLDPAVMTVEDAARWVEQTDAAALGIVGIGEDLPALRHTFKPSSRSSRQCGL